jgi:hypothetical protein
MITNIGSNWIEIILGKKLRNLAKIYEIDGDFQQCMNYVLDGNGMIKTDLI